MSVLKNTSPLEKNFTFIWKYVSYWTSWVLFSSESATHCWHRVKTYDEVLGIFHTQHAGYTKKKNDKWILGKKQMKKAKFVETQLEMKWWNMLFFNGLRLSTV